MPNEPVPLVGVTGGIGSGKTAACRCFGELGRTILFADDIARDLADRDPKVREVIRREFGPQVFTPEGNLSRDALARIVFGSAGRLRALNAIMHPRVIAAVEKVRRSPPSSPYIIVEAALVYESGLDAALNAVIVLRASEETRIRRVMQRDGMDRQQVIARVHAQMNPDRAARRADFVVHNDGSVEELRERVMFLDRLLVLHVAGPRKS